MLTFLSYSLRSLFLHLKDTNIYGMVIVTFLTIKYICGDAY
jgi:hypothetical protein